MKNVMVLFVLFLSITGLAQDRKNSMHAERAQFTPEQRTELKVKKLTLELDLSAKQQKEITVLVTEQQAKRQAMKAEMQNKRADNKKLTSDEKFVLKRNALDAQIAHKNEMKKVLNSEQFEKWEKMHKVKRSMTKKQMKEKRELKK